MFLLTASAHGGERQADLICMVPESLGSPGAWVTLTGIAEIAIAVGLQIHGLALWVGTFAVVMLCCLFAANVKAAREDLTILRKPVLSAGPRLLIQLVFVARSSPVSDRGGDQVFGSGPRIRCSALPNNCQRHQAGLLKEGFKCQSAGQTGGRYTRASNFWLRRQFPFPTYLLGRHHYDLGTCRSGERNSGFRRIRRCACVRFGSSRIHGSD